MFQITTLFLILIVIVGLLLGYVSTSGNKTQIIRLVDILIIGPLMIYLGWHNYKSEKDWMYLVLIFFGATTITYNWKNYLMN
jgi:hypothetical protein